MIYEKVKQICEQNGISIRALEKKAGLGNGTVQGWKESTPNMKSLVSVANALNVPVESLLVLTVDSKEA